MNALFRIPVIILFLSINVFPLIAQNRGFEHSEKEFSEEYARIYDRVYNSSDSLDFYSKKFQSDFTDFIAKNPGTLYYPFDSLGNEAGFHVQTSSDGAFRLYSWDTRNGGDSVEYRQIYQYTNGKKVNILIPNPADDEGLSDGFCSEIFTVEVMEQPVYFTLVHYPQYGRQTLVGYKIREDLIEQVGIFRNKDGVHDQIYVDFNINSVIDKSERPFRLITYDRSKKEISLAIADEDGNITGKKAVYKLQENYFVLQ